MEKRGRRRRSYQDLNSDHWIQWRGHTCIEKNDRDLYIQAAMVGKDQAPVAELRNM